MESFEKRRSDLVARAEADRNALAAAFDSVQDELHVADKIVATARKVSRHNWLCGVLAAGMIVTPIVTRKWLQRSAWWLPLVLAGYRVVKKHRSSAD
jgi:hypothetical protein